MIDTGIDLDHPDLNAISGKDCVHPGTTAEDDNGHGTHVAGTIARRNTGAGVVGIVPGMMLYAVKVLAANGSGMWSQVFCGIDWVTANAAALNIKVANMSLVGVGRRVRNVRGNRRPVSALRFAARSRPASPTWWQPGTRRRTSRRMCLPRTPRR